MTGFDLLQYLASLNEKELNLEFVSVSQDMANFTMTKIKKISVITYLSTNTHSKRDVIAILPEDVCLARTEQAPKIIEKPKLVCLQGGKP